MNKTFTHLHLHTEYSLLDGVGKIDEYLDRCKELGMSAMGVTDHGNLFCAIEFYKAAIKKGIKPIIGIEAYIGEKPIKDINGKNTELKEDEKMSYHIVLLAKNNVGYKNLIKISSYGYTEGFYYKPRVTKEFLSEHSEGVIALSACMAGELSRVIEAGRDEEYVDSVIKWYKEVFSDGYYIEIQGNGIREQKELNLELMYYSQKHNIPLVATNDTHYVRRGDHRLQDVLICIQTGAKLKDEKRMKIETEELFFKSREEMLESLLCTTGDIDNWSIRYNKSLDEIFKKNLYSSAEYMDNLRKYRDDLNYDISRALDNTNKIADSVGVNIEFGKFKFPKYKVPEEFSNIEEYLKHLVFKGLESRFNFNILEQYQERAEFELNVINKMGYAGYFVVVWDFIAYGKKQGIAIGPGRGSAAGSLVSYALGITDLDPIEYNLIFERFLNPERVSMPDIDIDICGERRQEIIDYVIKKYGEEYVAQIITFGRMKARAAVRDIGRVMDIPLSKIDKLAKLLPPDRGIRESINTIKEIKELYVEDLELQHVMDYGDRLENTVRHASVHAAGVVITEEPLTDNIPLYRDNKEKAISTQYQMKEVEELGILKMDFLGLRNLTILQKVQRTIEETRGTKYELSKIPLNDLNTYKMISLGDTTGVFQLESQGMRKLIRKLKPDRFQDVIALLALYRPGPLGSGMVDSFVNCKNRIEEIKYPDDSLGDILYETYGVILYQEQVMKIANKMASYTLGESDNLRRAMGKKDEVLMEKNREIFVIRSVENGYTSEKSGYIFDLIDKFAGYGFNKSHSAAYALVAYWTAYFKANYPLEFYTGILSAMNHVDNIAYYVEDAKNHRVEIKSPNINSPSNSFKIINGKIQYSLSGIKNIGEGFVEGIIEEFQKNGEFRTYEDFVKRMRKNGLNKKNLHSLIVAGGLDSLPGNRKEKIESIDKILDYVDRALKEDEIQQMNLFGEAKGVLNRFSQVISDEYSMKELLDLEKEILGFYFSAHPLDEYKKLIKPLQLEEISDILEEKTVHHVKTYGIIEELKKIVTKKDEKIMALFKLNGYYASISAVIFSREYSKYLYYIQEGEAVIIKGELQIDYFKEQENLKLIVKEIIPFSSLGEEKKGSCDILLDFNNTESFNRLKELILAHRGEMKLNFWNSKEKNRAVTSKISIAPSKKFLLDTIELIGEDNIKIRL